VCKGRSQVQQNFREEQEGPMKRSNHQFKIGSIRFAANDVAIVDADCAISGASSPDGQLIPTIKPHVTMVLNKAEGDWKILAARPVMYVPAPGAAS
jgi:ketosteroid isomerase-like protein